MFHMQSTYLQVDILSKSTVSSVPLSICF